MKNIKRQYINIFKVTFYVLVCFIIILVFYMIYSVLPYIIGYFDNWQNKPYYEIQHIVVTAIFTVFFTIAIRNIMNLKYMRTFISKVYSSLCQIYLTSHSVFACKIIESLIFIIYKGRFLPIKAQSNIEEEILRDLSEIINGNMTDHVHIISGDAHSGKTILAKKIISDIVSREEYVQLLKHYNRNIFYYDFACFQENVDEIVRGYERNFYKDSIVIFDNVHKLNNNQINLVLATVILSFSKAKCVLFFTRDIQYVIQGELTEEIEKKKQDHIISTSNLPKLQFAPEYDANGKLENFIADLDIEKSLAENAYVKFHLYYMYYIYIQNNNQSVIKLFKQLKGLLYSKPLLSGFIFICCSTLFTGSIDKKTFKKWIQHKNLHFYLNIYVEMGVLNNFCGIDSGKYSLHENTARAYVKYICRDESGRAICLNNFRFIANNIEKDELKYRYLLPINDDYAKILFNRIIQKGNFYILKEDIEFVIHVFNLNLNLFHYEFGILSDRIGHYQETKDYITRYYKLTANDEALIQLLHADHTMFYEETYYEKYNAMLMSDNQYLRFAASYWIQHINMHEGIWNLNDLLNILNDCGDFSEIVKKSYEGIHVLRRFYFDCYRVFYLEGNGNLKNFFNMHDRLSNIKDCLACELPEFEYYEKKIVYGHFIQYELLYRQHTLNNTYIEKRALKFVKCKTNVELKNTAINYYYCAYEYFRKNGDKTQYYVYLRICELAPEYVLSKILRKEDYEKPLSEFSYEDYKSIIGEYDYFRDQCGIAEKIYEYAAFAETYKMKFNIVCKVLCQKIDENFDLLINGNANAAIKFHQKYNPEHPNQYGIMRINLLKSLNNFLASKNKQKIKKELKDLKRDCLKHNFNREIQFINIIENCNYELSPIQLVDMIHYYPIVLQ